MVYRFGVIGAGMIGYWHAEAIRRLPDAELAGICDHGSGRAERFGPRCGCGAGHCGLDPGQYGGHSLRAGKATYLSDKGKSPMLIARHGRWKSMDMVLTYCRV